MKLQIATITANNYCRHAINRVLEAMQPMIQYLEKEGLIEEAKMTVLPYNGGYSIKVESQFNWQELRQAGFPEYFTYIRDIFIHPGAFFEEHIQMNDGGASIEYSRLIPEIVGETEDRVVRYYSTRKSLRTIKDFLHASQEWAEMIISQIDSLNEITVKS